MTTQTDLQYDAGVDDTPTEDLEYDSQMASLDAIASLEDGVVSSQKVDRMTMESLHRIDPDSISSQYPLVTYTQEPSQQNYEVALESFDVAKAVAIAAAGGLLGAILMYIIKLFRSDNVDTRIDYLEKSKDTIDDHKKFLKGLVRDAEKLELTPEYQDVLKKVASYDLTLIMDKPPKAPREVQEFVKAVSKGGDLHKVLDKWSKDIVQYTSEFRKRVRLLTECIETMHDATYGEIDKVIKKAGEVVVDGNHPFIKDMGAAWLLWQKLNVDENYTEFVKSSVVDTDVFYDLILNERETFAFDKLYSSSDKQIDKNLAELQKSAETLSGTKQDKMRAAAQRGAKTKTQTQGNHTTITIDAGSGGMNPNLIRAVREAEDSVRNESSMLTHYRTLLGRVLYFYQHAVAARQRVDNQFAKKAMEAQNSGQPK